MTLFEKIWNAHVVKSIDQNRDVIYIDKHLIHEVTSPQAFDGLRQRGLEIFRKERILATADHNVPTIDQHKPVQEPLSKLQIEKLYQNCKEYGVELFGLGHPYQGIVHVIGPELGITQPGMTIVCGDSHTSTHGAFGNIAFGIGTSQVEQVMATQCLILEKPKTMRINVEGALKKGVGAKDLILFIISKLTAAGGTGYFVEYAGPAIRSLSMEARMTICNMSIEMGARGGLIAPDQITFDYMYGRKFAPDRNNWHAAVDYWKTLYTDTDAVFDLEYTFNADEIPPMLTYGTNPGMGIGVGEKVPSENQSESQQNALKYMDIRAGSSLIGKKIQNVFIGSCTNSRIEDLRLVAEFLKGKHKSPDVKAYIVPGSKQVEKQAKEEGLDKIFREAGFELREPGCSACLGMNEDKIPAGEYCVSTSNRNFEGRQGQGARTILSGTLMAAAAAVEGKIVDVRDFLK